MDGMEWVELVSSPFVDWLLYAIEAGYYAGFLAIVVAAINLAFRRWLSAAQMGLLWGLVLLRLVVPLVPESPISLETLFVSNENVTTEPVAVPDATSALHVPPNPPSATTASNLSATSVAAATNPHWLDVLSCAIPLIWFAVGVTGFAFTVIRHRRFCHQLNRVEECNDARIRQLWAQCCEAASVKRTGRLLQFDGVEQPAIIGVFRPTLLLPTGATELNDEQLRMVMLHELAHVRRWDLAMNWGMLVIRTIYWWNPVYWLAASRFRSLREQACDAFVLHRLENRSTHGYGALLLALAEQHQSASKWRVMLPASILSFFPSVFRKRAVQTRLKALRRAGIERGRWHATGVAGIVVLLMVSGFTAATMNEVAKVDLATWMATHPDVVLASKRNYEVQEEYTGPRLTRAYELSKCIDRIAKDESSPDEARQALESTLKLLFFQPVPPGDATIIAHSMPRSDVEHKDVAATTDTMLPNYVIDGTTLLVTAPASLHDRLQGVLDAWTDGGLAQISVATRFLRADRDLVSELGVPWQFMEALSAQREQGFPLVGEDGAPVVRAEARVEEYLPLVVSTLSKEQTVKLIEIAQGNSRANVLNAPKITIFNGQAAMIADCVQRPFVVGVFQRVSGANEPKIVVLEEGTRINVRASQGSDRSKLHLEASLDMRSVGDVSTATTSFRGQPVSIQVPSVNRRSIDVAADIKDGQTLLVGFIPTDKQQQFFYYLLSAERIADK